MATPVAPPAAAVTGGITRPERQVRSPEVGRRLPVGPRLPSGPPPSLIKKEVAEAPVVQEVALQPQQPSVPPPGWVRGPDLSAPWHADRAAKRRATVAALLSTKAS